MRAGLVFVTLCACATARPDFDVRTIRKSDTVPAMVESGAKHVLTVYVEASCSHLNKAAAHFGGFWLTPGIVATAGHAMEARRHMFPDFALVSPDGKCVDGQYAEWHDSVDLLFIRARGRHEGHLELAKRLPAPGELAYQISGAMPVSHLQVTIKRRVDSRTFFDAKPIPRSDDSGSPLLDAEGKVIGMVIAIGSDNDAPEKQSGFYVSSLAISSFLSTC